MMFTAEGRIKLYPTYSKAAVPAASGEDYKMKPGDVFQQSAAAFMAIFSPNSPEKFDKQGLSLYLICHTF